MTAAAFGLKDLRKKAAAAIEFVIIYACARQLEQVRVWKSGKVCYTFGYDKKRGGLMGRKIKKREEEPMSLQFIIGPSGSGKTRYLYEQVIQESLSHPELHYFFLVPEQYTMQTQKELIRLHPRRALTNVDVLSFNRLAHRVFDDLGTELLTVLDDMGKSMILRKIAGEKSRELRYYQRHFSQTGFVNQLKSMISEMYQYGVTPQVLDQLRQDTEEPVLKEKLWDLELIFQGFQEYIQEKFTTAEEVLDLCCRLLPQWDKLRSSQIFLDGYTGFTPVQYRILEIMLGRCLKVRAAVTADPEGELYKEAGIEELFYMSRQMICRLIDAASRAGVLHQEDVILKGNPPERFRQSPQLAKLEGELRGRRTWDKKTGESGRQIFWAEKKNPAQEVRHLCRRIYAGLKEGLRFKDMAVITGDLDTYGREVRRQFEEQNIPFFLDDKTSILSNPLVEFIRSAIEAVRLDFPYESMFRCLKTGLMLSGAEEQTEQELFRMENYVKALGIRGRKGWESVWERQYSGGENLNLERLNQFKQEAAEPLFRLRESLEQKPATGRTMTEGLEAFLEELQMEEKLAGLSDRLMEAGNSEAASQFSQVYGLTIEMFQRLKGLLGDESMSLAEYGQILDAGFGEIQVGLLPAAVDRVVVGDITRTRLDDIRVLFFLGVNEGIIPQRKENRSFLTDEEREFFAAHQVELAPSARESGLTQRFYLYLLMTKPSKRLEVTWAARSGSGGKLRPSSLAERLMTMFPYGEADQQQEEKYPASAGEAVLALAEGLRQGETEKENQIFELYASFLSRPEYQELVRRMGEASTHVYEEKGIGREAARALYGTILQGSVTRLEQYGACAYAHFLKYGLELLKRQEYEVGAVDMGNLLHQSLDLCFQSLKDKGASLVDLTEEERKNLVEDCVISAAETYGNTIMHSSSRNAYLIRRLLRITDRTVWALGQQLKKGEFKPAAFEVSFSAADNLNAMKIALSQDEALYLKGRIDRLDLCEDETHVYVKIIDYKSGSTSFNLAAMYYGLQLQLVVYMDAAMEMEERRRPDKDVVPGGLFYYHIQDPLVEKKGEMTPEEIQEEIKRQLRMSGLVNSDLEVISLMDRDIEGESDVIPVAMKSGMIQEARSSVASRKRFGFLRDYVRKRCQKAGQEILEGNIQMAPYQEGTKTGCDYCPYHPVCGFDRKLPGCGYRKLPPIKAEEIWKEILPGEEEQEDAVDQPAGKGNPEPEA